MHVPHEGVAKGLLMPHRSPVLSTHQYVEAVVASAGRDTATAKLVLSETQVAEPPEESTFAAAIAFIMVALVKTLPVPAVVGQSARANVP